MLMRQKSPYVYLVSKWPESLQHSELPASKVGQS